jgi:hypothetical protein
MDCIPFIVFDLLFFSRGIPLAAGANMEREVNMAGSLEFPFHCCWHVHAPDGGDEYGWHAFLFFMMISRWMRILHSSRNENCIY